MAITLRTNKGSALTYDEMDKNFSQYFYSASRAGNIMTLYYTGSSNLVGYDASRTITVDLNPSEGTTPNLVVAAPERSIQYNGGSGQLGANAEFVFNTTGNLGIGTGTPVVKTHIKGNTNIPAILRLESISTTANVNRKSIVEFYHGTRNFGTIGKDNYADNDLYIKTYADDRFGAIQGKLIFNIGNNLNAGAFTTAGFGIGTTSPNYSLDVQGNAYFTGNVGIGTTPGQEVLNVFQNAQLQSTSGEFKHLGRFSNVPLSNINAINVSIARTSTGTDWTTSGMRLQQQVDSEYMGYIQFSGDVNNYGISMGTGTSGPGGSLLTPTERFRIDSVGRVGIGTKVGTEILTVQGNISGSGFIKVNGTATVTTLSAGSAATTSAVVATSVGLLQKIDAAPIPKGGIILWSGAINTIPAGWYLCNGNNGTPDLRDKFIVGAGSTYAVAATGGSADAVVIAHTHTATVAPTTNLTGQIGSIRNAGGFIATGVFSGGGFNSEDSGDGQSAAVVNFNANHGHTATISSAGESGTNKNLPPYYALAYIMYGGI
jgi:hypothetical protein